MSDNEQKSCGPGPGHFGWNELVTTDDAAARKFYTSLLGWKTEPFGGGGVDYTILKKGDTQVGGLMKAPKPGMPAQWVPYIFVDDVDATVTNATKLGATACMPPMDIPNVGRIAVISDPQGAVFGIIKPKM